MTVESTVVFPDRIEKLASVRTTGFDEWRAAVALCGELDVANAHEIRAELMHHLDAGRAVIRVDALAVEFMDSTALGALITASERCRAQHGSLILTNVPQRVQRLVSIAGLSDVLLIDMAGAHQQATA